MGQLDGRIALIVGAASGIGRAIATLYAQEGARLALMDLSEEGLVRTRDACSGSAISIHVADVTDEAAVTSAIDTAAAEHGGLDVLVNSAGILDETPLLDMDLAAWNRTLAVDLTGVFLAARHAVPHLVERGGGRIINVASQLGIKGGAGMAHYVAAKAGVIGFGKALALELAPHRITVNSIAPGPIETPLIEELSEDWRAMKRAELPLERFGTPEEVAPTALLLASSPGGNLYTGQTLGPNSGDVMP